MNRDSGFVLEITRQEDLLKMSIFEAEEAAATLKRYSQHKVDFSEIGRLCQEIASIFSKVGFWDSASIKCLQKSGQALWDNLLSRSVKEKLKGIHELDLTLIIDEELINIPWEILYDGTNFLCLNFNLGRLVRTKNQSTASQYRSASHSLKMLILANPTNDLKGAYLEGLSIKNQFSRRNSNIHVDFKSTNIDKLYVKKNFCDYDIVHFAGHCEHDSHNAKNSGWVLSDSKFSIQDILSMGQAASLPSLIFSNACYSATEDKPGLPDCDYQKKSYSIAAAFLFSGVRHYIGAIRKVEDSASLFFAKEFYHSLISGESVGKSLRLGRIKLIKEYGITSMHWANYLLYGDPAFSMFKIKHKALPARNKYILKWLKRWSVFLTAITVLVLISGFLYFWLPTVNPSSYYLYLKSKKLFNRGENIEVINIGNKLIKADPDFPNMYILLANAYYRLGDKENALKNYFDYALLSEKRGDFNQLAGSYAEIGWFYQLEGEYTKAYDFYNRAIEIARKNKDKLNEAVALRKLAVWHIDRKEYDAALSLLTKSSEINRERQSVYAHRYNLACDYFDIGLLFANQNDFATAEEFYKKSKIIFEKLSLKYELSDYYFNLGELYVFEKQFNKALSAYLAGLKIDQVQGNRVNLASDYNMIGELYIEMDRLIDAQLALEQSVTISRQLNSRSDLALAYRNLGLLFKKQGKKSKAKEYLRLAQEIYGQIDPIAYKEVKSEILGFDEPKSADLTNK